jgi:hypothetical protein
MRLKVDVNIARVCVCVRGGGVYVWLWVWVGYLSIVLSHIYSQRILVLQSLGLFEYKQLFKYSHPISIDNVVHSC